MSCRHDLANGTCAVCYPDQGMVFPMSCGPSVDGPEAAKANPDEARALLLCQPFITRPAREVIFERDAVQEALLRTSDPKRISELTERARLLGLLIRCRERAEAEKVAEEAKQPFGPGSLVRLKSGGPRMVVDSFAPGGRRICNWFESGRLVVQSFSSEALVQVEEPEGAPGKKPAAFKYKRGDRIQVLSAPYAGQAGTVTNPDAEGATVYLGGSRLWFRNENLALDPSPKNLFVVGGRVRVINGTYKGRAGVLMDAPSQNVLAGVRLDEQDSVGLFRLRLSDLAPEDGDVR